jgi:hypothetical protein
VLGSGVTALRRRPRNVAVVAVVWARYLLIGALDVLVVVIAFDRLDLGTGGAGLLGALVGAGAAASIPVTRAVAGRANLTSALAIGLAIAGMSCIALGAAVPDIVVYAALPVVGLCASSLNNLGRILLQRSADPRELGAVFAFVELVAGLGLLIGSGLALVLVELLGAASAPIGVGLALLGILVLTVRPLWLAAADADVPVVEVASCAPCPCSPRSPRSPSRLSPDLDSTSLSMRAPPWSARAMWVTASTPWSTGSSRSPRAASTCAGVCTPRTSIASGRS